MIRYLVAHALGHGQLWHQIIEPLLIEQFAMLRSCLSHDDHGNSRGVRADSDDSGRGTKDHSRSDPAVDMNVVLGMDRELRSNQIPCPNHRPKRWHDRENRRYSVAAQMLRVGVVDCRGVGSTMFRSDPKFGRDD
jgi:hypothetical protein